MFPSLVTPRRNAGFCNKAVGESPVGRNLPARRFGLIAQKFGCGGRRAFGELLHLYWLLSTPESERHRHRVLHQPVGHDTGVALYRGPLQSVVGGGTQCFPVLVHIVGIGSPSSYKRLTTRMLDKRWPGMIASVFARSDTFLWLRG